MPAPGPYERLFGFLKSSGRDKKPRQCRIERGCHEYISKRRQIQERNCGLVIVRRPFTIALHAAVAARVREGDDDGTWSRPIGNDVSSRRWRLPSCGPCRGPFAFKRNGPDPARMTTVAEWQDDRRRSAHETALFLAQKTGTPARCLSCGHEVTPERMSFQSSTPESATCACRTRRLA
jgi:hypothetical protein